MPPVDETEGNHPELPGSRKDESSLMDTADNTTIDAPSVDLSRPFATAALLYRRNGWFGTLPLPTRQKNAPPTGYTGIKAPWPEPATVKRWREQQGTGNIALRLGSVDSDYEVIGIDVDDYLKGGKKKNGGAQLKAIESEINCELPPTWTSSARIDGCSGIRYFRVPCGLRFRGQVDKDIEVIQKRHRFAVVWPSINPDTGGTVYWWFPPGAPLTEDGRARWDGVIPDARSLPILPVAWIDFLTHGRVKESDDPMDMDSSADELYAWADATFCDGQTMCAHMRNKVNRHVKSIAQEATSHDKLTDAHMSVYHLAREGHSGWHAAVNEIETVFKRVCMERDKRSADELRGEVWRSRVNGLRKVKGQCDDRVANGAAPVDMACDRIAAYPDANTFAAFLKRLAKLIGPRRRTPPNATNNRPELYDAKISAYIADRYLRGTYCYSSGFGWMQWSGKRWQRVGDSLVKEAVRLGVIDFHREEVTLYQRQVITADRVNATAKLLGASRIKSILDLSRGYLAVDDSLWDAHPDLLNCANGVIDLRGKTLHPHDPNWYLTTLCPTEYHSDATHPDWTKALEALPQAPRDWLQRRFGQALTGYTPPDDVLPFLKGGGENGKSTIVTGILACVGEDYAKPLPEKLLLARAGDHSTELMSLRGVRLAVVEELPELGYLNIKRLKTVTGTPMISARLCGKDNVTFEATHSVFVTTNRLPRVNESDHATWRRLAAVIFPFRYRKPGEPLDKPTDRSGDLGLRDRIKIGADKQHEAILAWLVDGAAQWYHDRESFSQQPSEVIAASRAWRDEADVLAEFQRDCIVFDSRSHMMTTDLFALFSRWLKDREHQPWTDQTFVPRWIEHPAVVEAGVVKRSVRKSRPGLSRPPLTDSTVPEQYQAWVGIRMKAANDVAEDQ